MTNDSRTGETQTMDSWTKQAWWLSYQMKNVYGNTKKWWYNFTALIVSKMDGNGPVAAKQSYWMAQQLGLVYNDCGQKWLDLAKESTDKMKDEDLIRKALTR